MKIGLKIRYLILLWLMCITYISYSQSISVSNFKLLDTDLTANTAGTMELDQNGETAALIKVVTTQTGFTFDGGSMGIVKTKQTPGEVWVYIPRGAKKISIKHPQLGVLRDYYFPVAIEPAKTYEMVLVAGEVQTIVKQARTSQYVVFNLTPPDAVVELDGELLKTEGGVASKMMKFGTYNYRIKAPDYLSEAGAVTIDDPNNKKVVNISLKPNFAQVTIKVDNNAEIWVNGEKKGAGSWTGNLGAGTYELEAKKAGHRSTMTTRDIDVTPEPQIVTLQAPIPVYGEADINSSPGMADIYIDGEKVGQTPQLISDLLIGKHDLSIVKDGYAIEYKTIEIKEGDVQSISIQLKEKKNDDLSTVSSNYSIKDNQLNTNNYPQKSDPNALKAILNTSSYSQAEYILKNNINNLTIKDRAVAYNKLVDLAYKAFSAQSTIQTENQLGKNLKHFDEKLMSEMAFAAVSAALECDKYDQMPNEKGKVSPKFAKKNAERLWTSPRLQLVNAGQEALTAGDNAKARKYWEIYALSDLSPMFKYCDREAQKPFFGQVARFAAVFAFQDKDMAKALELADIAMKDPEEKENALYLKLEILGAELKTKDDSVKFCNQLKDIYANDKNDGVMEKLYNVLLGLGDEAGAYKILDDALAANPNNFVALADKGLALLQANKAAEAVIYLKKAFELKPDNAIIATYAGTAYSVQAQNTDNKSIMNDLYSKAIYYFDKAKELDPNRLQSNWCYNRYNAYYHIYGPDDNKTKQAEADCK